MRRRPVPNIGKLSLCFALAIASSAGAAATHGTPGVRFDHIPPDAGLSQSYVFAITQDQDGFLWFGTQDGLNRFDGSNFVVYDHNPQDPQSLSSDTIRSIVAGASGALWIGTDTGGLSQFDRERQTFINYRHDPDDSNSIASDQIRVIYQDREGYLWIGTDGAGLDRFDPKTKQFVHHLNNAADVTSISNNHVWSIVEEDSGVLWVGTEDGLNRFDRASGRFERFAHDSAIAGSLSDDRIRCLLIDDSGVLWAGTENGGLNRLDYETGTFDAFRHDEADPFSISADRITGIFQDSHGALWVSTSRGLNVWNPSDRQFTSFYHDPDDRYSLAHDNVLSVYQDRGGILWIGTYNGINKWNTANGTIRHYRHRPGDADSISSNTVFTFAEDARQRIWVGTFGGGINILDRTSGSFSHIRHKPDDVNSMSSDKITSITIDSDGIVWIGTRSEGLNRYDPTARKFRRYRHDASDASSLSANGVTDLLIDSDGALWVATFGGGLNRYDSGTDSFEHFRHDPVESQGLSSDRLFALHEDSLGYIWIATYSSGLNRLDRASGDIKAYRAGPGDGASPNANEIFSIFEDSRGDLWIGTNGNGLSRWKLADRRDDIVNLEHITERNGLPSATIYSITEDSSGRMWFGTLHGISSLDRGSMTFRNFNVSHGLQGNEFNLSAVHRSADGSLFFGGNNGFNAFRPDELEANTRAPKIALTGFSKLNRPVDIGAERATGQAVQLNHKDYVIAFDFAALDFTAPAKNRYMYRLDGLDTGWIASGTKRQATYTNLAPGNYRFRVRGSNSDGVWSTQAATLDLTVSPAPWKTWWAYTLYAGVASLFAFMLFRMQIARHRQATIAEHAKQIQAVNTALQHEISIRKNHEAALQSEKTRAQAYFDVAEVVLLILDEDRRVRLINSKGANLLGVAAANIVGRDWMDFVSDEARDQVAESLREAWQDHSAPQINYREYSIRAEDGMRYLIAWNRASLASEGGKKLTLFSGMDITRVRNLEQQMRIEDKMNAIGTLASGIAHDFNNILQSIYGFASLTLDLLPPNDEKISYLHHVVQGTDRARNLVKRMLAFSRHEEYDLAPIDIAPAIREASALLRGSLPPAVTIRTEICETRRPVLADPTRIHQVVMNLGANAGHAMAEDGGTLAIRLERLDIDSDAAAVRSANDSGTQLVLSISDEGCGMRQSVAERVFEPFFTTRDVGAGSGLGLTVVHNIVESHKGRIEIDSAEGKGTTVRVFLPCCDEAIRTVSATKPVSPGTESILVVDDEAAVALVTQKLIEIQGYKVCTCDSGEQALELFRSDPGRFDLVLTDEAMPGMTGSELIDAMRAHRPRFPAIIMSGRAAPAGAARMDTYFLQKPCTREEVGNLIRRVLDERISDTVRSIALVK